MAIAKDIDELDAKDDKKPVATKPLAVEKTEPKTSCTNCGGTGLDGEVLCATCEGSGLV